MNAQGFSWFPHLVFRRLEEEMEILLTIDYWIWSDVDKIEDRRFITGEDKQEQRIAVQFCWFQSPQWPQSSSSSNCTLTAVRLSSTTLQVKVGQYGGTNNIHLLLSLTSLPGLLCFGLWALHGVEIHLSLFSFSGGSARLFLHYFTFLFHLLQKAAPPSPSPPALPRYHDVIISTWMVVAGDEMKGTDNEARRSWTGGWILLESLFPCMSYRI